MTVIIQSLVFDYDLDEPPAKVWRAISIPEFRKVWLPEEAEPVFSCTEQEVRYKMRDSEPPYLESNVTFHLSPNSTGGTHLRVIHKLTDAATRPMPSASNINTPSLLAA
ncbi:polyketide cyclase [Rhizobium sp. CFBP 8762]|uniref:SRPBCC family protein n=1 Tax=Rhizobium sp. CFBP 8762 TaxID=2775279 RepID=UPI00177E4598|nr:polyketide cyclase [Rhizobium sp. CFBP 8762]MBD8556778.1 polyketide cyclase [Rhizobium sp. CFBP 8762]